MEITEIKRLIRRYALQNAVKYGKTPQKGAVMGKLMGEHPELRNRAREVAPLVDDVILELEGMKADEWRSELEKVDPSLIDEIFARKEPKKGLPDLEGVKGEVVMRFAPNPNGAPTLGNARGIIVNDAYVKRYGGKFILRFDDTDPSTKRPLLEAYGWYIEDLKWLGVEPEEVIYASDRVESYYEYARELIELGKAYVCFCTQEEFKRLKDAKKPCPHRDTPSRLNLDRWEMMLDGEYPDKAAVLRIKTDITHKDPAIRDWVAFRIVREPHPRVGSRYIVWPMLDFESAIEDHVLGITHIIRGKDLIDSERRQRFIYDYLGWEYPVTIHWGRIKIHEFGRFSTSELGRDIEKGLYSGWDDPRLPTLRALRRRGIQPEAIRKVMIEMGLGENDVAFSMKNLYGENRKILDPVANRYFFVPDPLEIVIEGGDRGIKRIPVHPEKSGFREVEVGGSFYIPSDDFNRLNKGDILRLKYLFNIRIEMIEPPKGSYLGEDPEYAKEIGAPIIQWVPPDTAVPVDVIMPDGEVVSGLGEISIRKELGNVVQFERFGFVRIDSVDNDRIKAYFAHK
ncbi:MAG: glutamate--tRNA ligase [Candidatus Syntrophoarchaeum sp. WYZ-LMO15]|nr:MAG: glutamate--tRNA ligase [Candidatus Syntrophoarchaeum sp. WYZ-LMO15]